MAVRFNCQFAALIKLNRAPRRLKSSENAPLGPGGLRWSLPRGDKGHRQLGAVRQCATGPGPVRQGPLGLIPSAAPLVFRFPCRGCVAAGLDCWMGLGCSRGLADAKILSGYSLWSGSGMLRAGELKKTIFLIFGIGPHRGHTLTPPCAKTPL